MVVVLECCYVGNIVVSRDKTLAFCLVQVAAMMTTAATKRAKWMARNTSEGKNRLVIRHACHCESPAAKNCRPRARRLIQARPEREGSVFGRHR